ncbi:MAG: hypothetical protein QOJ62_465 [Actinomycetota bacterium]|nr:hypothetical protein [Actinomycetota bacterium]
MSSTGHEPTAAAQVRADRYAAVVAALLDVRIDHPTAQFDAELDAGVADGRIDAPTARALRWWQRASMRAAETYAAAVVPGAIAASEAADSADARAAADADDLAATWRRAGGFEAATTKPTALAEPTEPTDPSDLDDAESDITESSRDSNEPTTDGQPLELRLRLYPRWNSPAHLAAVPDFAATGHRTASTGTGTGRPHEPFEETTRAIRAAFRSRGPAPAPPSELIDETPAPTLHRATFEGKERRGYADPATSA